MTIKSVAVLMLNLGGPDSLNSVKPFLFNLFNDKHIIDIPQPFRYLLAKIISTFRLKKSYQIYKQMGGKSPILEETKTQAKTLEQYLNFELTNTIHYRVIPLMRYWHPMSQDVIKILQTTKTHYDCVILLPLYPQFSFTTTLSSFKDWSQNNKSYATKKVCCYYNNRNFILAYVQLLKQKLTSINTNKTIRVLFSAHSIPQRVVDKGDPYENQIISSTKAIIEEMYEYRNIKYSICYQSKVGKMKWLEPSLKSAIIDASKNNEVVVVLPISFTSEHSETLVELDIEYANFAKENNVEYYRVSTVRVHPLFIKCLAELVINTLNDIPQDSCTLHCQNKICYKNMF